MPILEMVLGVGTPDTSGDIYPSTPNAEMTLTNAKGQQIIMMEFPTGSDIGVSTSFRVPTNYASSGSLVIRGILDGTPANVLAFGAQQLERDVSDSVDTAYETEDLANNSTWTGYADEDEYEEIIELTPASAYTPGRTVYLWIYRDNDVDTTTFNFLLTGLYFRYSDT